MSKTIKGDIISEYLFTKLNNYLKDSKLKIVDISIGNDCASITYSKMKQKVITSKTSILVDSIHFDNITKEDLIAYINNLNNDNSINGIMIQLPLPGYLKEYEREILDCINPNKDVDGLTTTSINNLKEGKISLVPCTAIGILTLLKVYVDSLENKKIAIINRSNIVGKPLYQLLLKEESIPTICHSKTEDIKSITKESDILIAALNKKEYIDASYLKEKCIVIDVGVHKDDDKIVGDVNYNDVINKVSLITSPTKCVGPMTICMLAYNTAKTVYKEKIDDLLIESIEELKKKVKKYK